MILLNNLHDSINPCNERLNPGRKIGNIVFHAKVNWSDFLNLQYALSNPHIEITIPGD